jgi:hypothetical protein
MSGVFWVISKIFWTLLLLLGLFLAWSYFGNDLLMARPLEPGMLSVGLIYGALAPLSLGKLISLTERQHKDSYRDPRVPLTIRRTRFTFICFIFALLMVAAACISRLVVSESGEAAQIASMLGLIVVALAVFGASRYQATNVLVLDPEGLQYGRFKNEAIAWRDIIGARIARAGKARVIALDLVDEEKYVQKGFRVVPRWLSFLVPSRLMISPDSFDVSPEWLRTAIQVRLEAFGFPRSQSATVQRQGTH